MNITDYTTILNNKNVKAFLSLIKYTEGANYNTLFGGGTFSDYSDHPRQKIIRTLGGTPITSSAAGAYQFLSGTWDECKNALALTDFLPISQDKAAVFLINRRGALEDVVSGLWEDAIKKCNREWASLPGSPYGQPTKSLSVCLTYLNSKTEKGEATASVPFTQQPQQEKTTWFHSLLLLFQSFWKRPQT
jgi:lysozyme